MARKHWVREPRTRDGQRHEVVVVKPGIDALDPLLRGQALRLAQGDPRRIEVLSPTVCIVR
jgi:hypothetical protein